MVNGREKDGQVDDFGVSGYVYKNVFLIYDRKTESLWHPLGKKEWTAISGSRKGETIAFAEPEVIPLGEWRKQYPNTTVLLGSKRGVENTEGAGD